MKLAVFTIIVIALAGVTWARPLPQAVQTERAYQDREILYELQSPESHAFRIAHDYTVRKVGEQYYFNIVRAGSHVSDPESLDLDTGEKLKWETISGKQATAQKLPVGEPVKDD